MNKFRGIIYRLVEIRHILREYKKYEESDWIRDFLKEWFDVDLEDRKEVFKHGKPPDTIIEVTDFVRKEMR